jgi:hypothetical protein
MRKGNSLLSQIVIWSIAILAISACTTQEIVKVQSWIDTPRDGATYEVNTPVQIMSHAYAKEGVGEIVLYINGEAYRRDAAPPSEDNLISLIQEWIPTEAGQYVVEVKAMDVNGKISAPAIIGVEISDEKMASDTPTITVSPTEDISPTPDISETPTATLTFTPTIAIWTNTPTITPSITAKPVDNQAPPAPSPQVPANGLELSCRATQTLAWLPVSDESGISGYYVKLELLSGTGQWQSAAGYGPITDKQVEIPIECGIKYRWMVRAQDGAGNFSDWSSTSEFIIVLN